MIFVTYRGFVSIRKLLKSANKMRINELIARAFATILIVTVTSPCIFAESCDIGDIARGRCNRDQVLKSGDYAAPYYSLSSGYGTRVPLGTGSLNYGLYNYGYPSCNCPHCSAATGSNGMGVYVNGGYNGNYGTADGSYNFNFPLRGPSLGENKDLKGDDLTFENQEYFYDRPLLSGVPADLGSLSIAQKNQIAPRQHLGYNRMYEDRLSYGHRTMPISGNLYQRRTSRLPDEKLTNVEFKIPSTGYGGSAAGEYYTIEDEATFGKHRFGHEAYPGSGHLLTYNRDLGYDLVEPSGNKFVNKGPSSSYAFSQSRPNQEISMIHHPYYKDIVRPTSSYGSLDAPLTLCRPDRLSVNNYNNGPVGRYDRPTAAGTAIYGQAAVNRDYYNLPMSPHERERRHYDETYGSVYAPGCSDFRESLLPRRLVPDRSYS